MPYAYEFPSPSSALLSPNGLLAIGGDLSSERLLSAYRQGIFPWFNPGEPILWWSPDPRAVLFLDELKVSRSLAKVLRQHRFQISFDQCFTEVIRGCANAREETWITPEMITAYSELHQLGHAHSVEVWQGTTLVGGLYGVSVGSIFCGESMFSLVSNASKVAMVHLVSRLRSEGYSLLDCQVPNPHLLRLGVRTIARKQYLSYLEQARSDLL